MKFFIPKDCDNAPKRKIIKDFILSTYQWHWQNVEAMLDKNFKLKIVGEKEIENFEALKIHFSKISAIEELGLKEILSHGKHGACNGEIRLKDQIIDFAYFFEFKSAGKNTIYKITEYRI